MAPSCCSSLFFLTLLLATSLAGQVATGSLAGYVLDPDGRAVPQARLTLTGAGVERQADADAQGYYRFPALRPGRYDLAITAERLAPRTVNGVVVAVDTVTRVDPALALPGLTQSTEVRASARATESAALGAVVMQSELAGLPLNRRDFLQLALLAAGVNPPVEGSELSKKGGFALHAHGAREEFNNFLLDGVDNNDPNINRYTLQPPVDAIQEFKIGTGNMSAEYGRSAGAQVNVVTRSGGEQVHGFLYEYFRHRYLDARNFFSGAAKPHFVRHQFGGGIGGPVKRESTFFFVNWDGLRERRGVPRLGTVPLESEKQGDLSTLSGTPLDPFTRQPFPGKRIPATRLHPVARQMMTLFPSPNRPGAGGNLLSEPLYDGDQAQWNARIDHRLTARDQLTVRYSNGAADLFEPYSQDGGNLPGFGDFVRDRGHNALVQHQRVFSPRLLHAFLAGFNRVERRVLPENIGTDVNRLWGVAWLPTKPIGFGYPAINIAGYSGLGDATAFPIDRAGNTYQLSETISLTARAHLVKFGVEARRIQHNGINDLLTRGSLTFGGAVSGTGLSDALLGLPQLGIQAQADNVQTLRTTALNLFVQDDWKLSRRLTLNLGVRYEYNTPPTDPTDRLTVFDLATRTLARAGTNGVSRSGLRPDRNNVAPRIGAAWSVDERTVVRAGYGVYYDSGLLVANTALYFNPPYFVIRVFFPTATSLLTLDNPFRGGITPPASLSSLSADIRSAYLQHWNAAVEREVLGGALTVAYAGSKGTALLRSRDLNQPRPGAGDIAARRPYPAFANIFYTESGGNSSYHALETSFVRRLARGWALRAAYTYAKSIDDTSAFLGTRTDKNFPQDSQNFGAERGLSSFDQRQRLSVAGVWEMKRGWEWNLLASAATGQPLTPVLRFDNSNTGNTGGQFGSDRPNALRDAAVASPSANAWFDASAFAVAPRFAFGNAGRNTVTGPGYASVDTAVARRIRLREALELRLEAQIYNLLNRTNFDMPERFADEPATFARILSAKAPRQVQFSARLRW